MKHTFIFLFFLLLAPAVEGREIPTHDVPVPATASPQLQKAIDKGLPGWWREDPKTKEEWRIFREKRAAETLAVLPDLREALKVERTAGQVDGVPVYTLTPAEIPPRNRDKVLLNLHGGGYALNPGEAATQEGIYMAGIGGFKVICVDYRLAPDHPYPAALDDAMAVYKALLKEYLPSHIGIFGTSTGGGMTLALMLRAKQEGVPLPGAIACGTPWTDLAKIGDSYFSNEHLDNVLVGYDGWIKAAAEAYAHGHDLKDPFISPAYGDFKGLPPVLLGTGTRDLFLSNTVRAHQKLREAGVTADLLVLEGISHAQYMLLPPDTPETIYYYRQMAQFFEKYLK